MSCASRIRSSAPAAFMAERTTARVTNDAMMPAAVARNADRGEADRSGA